MLVTKIDTHKEIALSRFPEQDKESNNIVNLITAFINQWQELEYVLWDMHSQRDLMTAKGKSLDFLGNIVDEPRSYRQDEEYRLAILQKIIQDNIHGTPEEIISLIAFFVSKNEILPTTYQIKNLYTRITLLEWQYNSFIIKLVSNLDSTQIGSLNKIIFTAKPSGVDFLGIIIIPLQEAVIFDELQDANYDYAVDKLNTLLDTNHNNTLNTLEVIKADGKIKSGLGFSELDNLNNIQIHKGYFSELMD